MGVEIDATVRATTSANAAKRDVRRREGRVIIALQAKGRGGQGGRCDERETHLSSSTRIPQVCVASCLAWAWVKIRTACNADCRHPSESVMMSTETALLNPSVLFPLLCLY
jgi:hypothetical protein